MWQTYNRWRGGAPALAGIVTIAFAAAPLGVLVPGQILSPVAAQAQEAQDGTGTPLPAAKGSAGRWTSLGFRVSLIASYVDAVQHSARLSLRVEELSKMIAALEARRLTGAEEIILKTWLSDDLTDEQRTDLETELAGNLSEERKIGIEARIDSDLTDEEKIEVEKKLSRSRKIDTVLVPLHGELSAVEAEHRQSMTIENEVLDAIVNEEVTDNVVRIVNEFLWPEPPDTNKTRDLVGRRRRAAPPLDRKLPSSIRRPVRRRRFRVSLA